MHQKSDNMFVTKLEDSHVTLLICKQVKLVTPSFVIFKENVDKASIISSDNIFRCESCEQDFVNIIRLKKKKKGQIVSKKYEEN